MIDADLRAELRAWLAQHPPPAADDAAARRAWQRTLHEGGWVGVHWPIEHGGRGASAVEVAVYNEELARAGAPPMLGRVGVTLVGPTLIAHGTDAQRARWMPRILAGDDIWCQLFSEPGAGSDLASLTTRAVRHAEHYRVTGQKVWSSYATEANLGIALVRTDPDARAHKGISMLAIPMDAKGVDVRPLRQLTGDWEFNEVFLDDVEVPLANVIGPENEGWRVANTTLANERGASFIWREQVLQELAVAALTPAVNDALSRQTVARCHIDAEIFGWHNARTLARIERGEEIGAASSIVKLFWAQSSQYLYDAATMIESGDRWEHSFLSSRANSIMGGTSEIQRNIIGERLLGLPREP
ncbi:MAG TPA: acyl-CoA dehydrogenase family protein [Acidimicrobiia bacterium]|jgi:alkylation response protein AidB-like acyl-CoA dehydrogenase|nr:acyl-CoA dehydrogenase family protein [Acidimicrobiia bacterium]